MAVADIDTAVTYFANPYLRCDSCGKRAVGFIGQVTTVVNILNGLVTLTMPATVRNWPCYHVSTRTSMCSNWVSTAGCTHTIEQRAEHSHPAGQLPVNNMEGFRQ